MDTYEMAFSIGLVVGAVVMGALVGLIPLILGMKRGKTGLGVAGIISCIVGNFILGIFLSIPICIIFVVVILVLTRKKPEEETEAEEAESQQL